MSVSANDIQGLYIAYFNRPADFLGLQFWTDAANKAGGNINAVANAFAASTEYTTLYAGMSTPQIIDTIYMNLFGRHAELDGIKFWGSALDNKVLGIGNIAYQIMKGAQDTVGGFQDATAVANKVIAATAFYNALDTSAEVIAYNGTAADNVVKTWLSGVTDQASLDAATSDAGLTAVTSAVVAVSTPPVPAVNLSLSTGVDALAGGAGNDVFNGVLGTAAHATLTAFDSIDGAAGNNTLNIVDTDTANAVTSIPTGVTIKNIQTLNVSSAETAGVNVDGTTIAGLTTLNVNASVGADIINAATTTAILVNDATLANGVTTISGGSSITAIVAGVTTGGAVNVGSSTTAGAISATVSDIAAAAGTSQAGSAVTVAGGTTVSVVQNIAAGVSNTTAASTTGGAVTVKGGAATSAVAVQQSAAVAQVAASAAVNETAAITVGAGGLTAGQSLTIAGLTVTAGVGGLTQANLETIFASRAAGFAGAAVSTETYSGAITGFTTGAAAAHVITATSVTAGTNVTDLTFTDANSALTSVVETQGAAVGAITAAVGGIIGGTVNVVDANSTDTTGTKANTIKTVILDGYGANSTVNSNALTSLTLANSAAGVTVTDTTATPTNTTLSVTVNKLGTGASLADATIKTLNVTATGAASKLNVTGAALTTVTVAGDQKVSLAGSTMAAVTAFTSTNTGGVTVALNAGSTGSFGAGADVVTLAAASTKAITLGAGNDTAIISTLAASATVDGGTGTNTLQMAAVDAAAASLSNVFAGQVTNFQSLTLSGATNQTIDLAVLGGYTTVSTSGGNGLTLNNTVSGENLSLTAAGTAYIVNQTNALAGTSDVLNVNLTAAANTSFGSVTAANVETVKIVTTDSSATPAGTVTDTFTLAGNDAKSIVLSGTAHTALTAASTALTSFDASGLVVTGAGAVGTGVTWTSGALTASATVVATIKGSANGGDLIDASASLKAVTITEVKGANTITGSSTAGSTLTGGSGLDHINGGAGKDVIVSGGGADVIHGGAGADLITVSGGKNSIVQSSGDAGANTATSIQTSELTSTFDVVKGLVAGDKIDLSALNGTHTYVTGDLVLAAANLTAATNTIAFATGTYDAANGVFTYGAAGADTVVTYDHSGAGTGLESIILVGYHAGSTTAAAAGIITLG